MNIQGISHITLICQNLHKSSRLLCDLLGAVEVYSSDDVLFSLANEKFLLLGDLWIALMEGIPPNRSYQHIAFQIREEDFASFEAKIASLGLEQRPSRPRHPQEGRSIYFYDEDHHLFELHTGTLSERLDYYRSFPRDPSCSK